MVTSDQVGTDEQLSVFPPDVARDGDPQEPRQHEEERRVEERNPVFRDLLFHRRPGVWDDHGADGRHAGGKIFDLGVEVEVWVDEGVVRFRAVWTEPEIHILCVLCG